MSGFRSLFSSLVRSQINKSFGSGLNADTCAISLRLSGKAGGVLFPSGGREEIERLDCRCKKGERNPEKVGEVNVKDSDACR